MKKTLSIITMLIFISQLSFAGTGTSGGQFLKIDVDAVSSALGGTMAVSEGVSGVFQNPAGLSWVSNIELAFSQVVWIEDVQYTNAAFAKSTPYGTFAFGINYLSMGSINKVDNTGAKLAESFTPSDMCFTLGYGSYLSSGLDYGCGIKFINSIIAERSASAFAFDAGAKKKFPDYRTEIGIIVKNVGTEMKFIKEGDPLPLTLKLGGKYVLPLDGNFDSECYAIDNGINFFGDISYVNDSGINSGLGTEYIRKISGIYLAGRIGYKTGITGLEGISGFSAGFGLYFKNYGLDYAIAPYGELGLTHRISITCRF